MRFIAFTRSVLPPLAVEFFLALAEYFVPYHDLFHVETFASLTVSCIVLPLWAGARVAKAGGGGWWSAFAGPSLLSATLVAALLAQPFVVERVTGLWPLAVVTLVALVPIQMLFAWLGRLAVRHKVPSGA